MNIRIGNHLVVDLLDKLSPNFINKYEDIFKLFLKGEQNDFELTNRFLIDMNASHEEAF